MANNRNRKKKAKKTATSQRVSVSARLTPEERDLLRAAAEYAGKTNMFRGSVSLADVPEGAYLIIVATDPDRENFGSSKKLKIGAH